MPGLLRTGFLGLGRFLPAVVARRLGRLEDARCRRRRRRGRRAGISCAHAQSPGKGPRGQGPAMTLLDFARGPGLHWALWIFAFGVLWRLVGSFLLLRTRDLSKPRGTHPLRAGLRAMLMRSVPPHELEKNI